MVVDFECAAGTLAGKAQERGCCRANGFTDTACPLRVRRRMAVPCKEAQRRQEKATQMSPASRRNALLTKCPSLIGS